MTRVRRYINTYGDHTKVQRGWDQYRRISPTEGPWVGSKTDIVDMLAGATRLVPRKSDHHAATDWGMYAYNVRIPPYDYRTASYQYRGAGTPSTAGLNQRGLPSGITITRSSTHVQINLPSSLVASCHNAARAKAGEGFNAALFAAEGRSTLAMLADLLQRLVRAYKAARRGDWRNAFRQLGARSYRPSKDAANNWLQFQYGVMPLVYDAYDLQEHIKRGLSRNGNRHRVKVNRTQKVDAVTALRGSANQYNKYYGHGCRYGISVVFDYKIDDAYLSNLNRLGMLNPFALAWELVPLSFVLDWFLPIGAFLNALMAPYGTTFVSGYETRYLETEATCLHCRDGHTNYRSGVLQSIRVQIFASQRQKLTAFPSAKIGLGLGVDSIAKGLTALALLRQRA